MRELLYHSLHYYAERGKLMPKAAFLRKDDEALSAVVTERLATAQRFRVSLDNL